MPSNRTIWIVLSSALVLIGLTGGYAIAQLTAYHGNYSSKYGNSGSGYSTSPNSGYGYGGGAAAGFSSSPLAQSIAEQAGTRLAGQAPQTVSASQARTLSQQAPAGASIDRSTKTITFTGSTVSFTVVAIAPGLPDMTFGIAGLANPTVIVPKGAQVTVQFINADSNEAHGWLVSQQQPPFNFGQSSAPALSGAAAGVIGDPTAAGDGANTVTFQASTAGTYYYICPMPGHAQMGMHGQFVVR